MLSCECSGVQSLDGHYKKGPWDLVCLPPVYLMLPNYAACDEVKTFLCIFAYWKQSNMAEEWEQGQEITSHLMYHNNYVEELHYSHVVLRY